MRNIVERYIKSSTPIMFFRPHAWLIKFGGHTLKFNVHIGIQIATSADPD